VCCEGLMLPVHAARGPRGVRTTDSDHVNLFLLPSMTITNTTNGSNQDSGRSAFLVYPPTAYLLLFLKDYFSLILCFHRSMFYCVLWTLFARLKHFLLSSFPMFCTPFVAFQIWWGSCHIMHLMILFSYLRNLSTLTPIITSRLNLVSHLLIFWKLHCASKKTGPLLPFAITPTILVIIIAIDFDKNNR